MRNAGLIPGSGMSPGGGHGNPFQYPCLKNLLARGSWQATVHRVAKSRTRRKQLSTQHSALWIYDLFYLDAFLDAFSPHNSPHAHKFKKFRWAGISVSSINVTAAFSVPGTQRMLNDKTLRLGMHLWMHLQSTYLLILLCFVAASLSQDACRSPKSLRQKVVWIRVVLLNSELLSSTFQLPVPLKEALDSITLSLNFFRHYQEHP